MHYSKYRLLSLLVVLFTLMNSQLSYGQFGYGLTATTELYSRFRNPSDATGASPSAGSALINLGVGPKIWFGNKKRSLSLEALANIHPFALSTADYKGIGAVSFPIMAKFNFNGLSGLEREGLLGFSIGGGIQYSRTELFGVTQEYKNLGVNRSMHRVYIVQAGYGFGVSGACLAGFVRYGFNPDNEAKYLSVGVQYDFNFPLLRKISSPESEL